MTRAEHNLTGMLQTLVYSLSGKIVHVDYQMLKQTLAGVEIAFPDIDHFQIAISASTGRARLTDNSRQDVKTAWGSSRCKGQIAELERHVAVMRQAMLQMNQAAERRAARRIVEKS